MIKCLRGWQSCFAKWFIDGNSEVRAYKMKCSSSPAYLMNPFANRIWFLFWQQARLRTFKDASGCPTNPQLSHSFGLALRAACAGLNRKQPTRSLRFFFHSIPPMEPKARQKLSGSTKFSPRPQAGKANKPANKVHHNDSLSPSGSAGSSSFSASYMLSNTSLNNFFTSAAKSSANKVDPWQATIIACCSIRNALEPLHVASTETYTVVCHTSAQAVFHKRTFWTWTRQGSRTKSSLASTPARTMAHRVGHIGPPNLQGHWKSCNSIRRLSARHQPMAVLQYSEKQLHCKYPGRWWPRRMRWNSLSWKLWFCFGNKEIELRLSQSSLQLEVSFASGLPEPRIRHCKPHRALLSAAASGQTLPWTESQLPNHLKCQWMKIDPTKNQELKVHKCQQSHIPAPNLSHAAVKDHGKVWVAMCRSAEL